MQYIKVYMLASGWLDSQTVQIGRMAATFVKEKRRQNTSTCGISQVGTEVKKRMLNDYVSKKGVM
jgi:hypothetical protein